MLAAPAKFPEFAFPMSTVGGKHEKAICSWEILGAMYSVGGKLAGL